MRITIVMPGQVWKPGGSHRVAFEYANQFAAMGHAVTLVFPWLDGSRPPRGLVRGLHGAITTLRRALTSPRPAWFPLDRRVRLRSALSAHDRYLPDGDVVVATQWFLAELLPHYQPRRGAPVYLIHHHESLSGAPQARVDATWQLACHKVAVSRWTYEQARALGVTQIAHIPNGVDHGLYRLLAPIAARGPHVVMGYVNKAIKDPATGIAALEQLKAARPDVRASLFGTGPRDAAIPSWVAYHRNRPHAFVVEQLYNTSALALCCSRAEGFGFIAAEAMACGCALVSTDCGGIRDYAAHGRNALLCAPGDADALAGHMRALLDQPERRIALARAGVKRMAAFTWQRSAGAFECLLVAAARGQTIDIDTSAKQESFTC